MVALTTLSIMVELGLLSKMCDLSDIQIYSTRQEAEDKVMDLYNNPVFVIDRNAFATQTLPYGLK